MPDKNMIVNLDLSMLFNSGMSPYLKNIILNYGKGSPLSVVNSGEDETTIYIYNLIGEWGISAEEFSRELALIETSVVRLRFNSPGGDLFASRAMGAAMKSHAAKFIGHVDGVAASAASTLALECDEVVIDEGGMFMIHEASTGIWGNKGEIQKVVNLLTKIDDNIADSIAKKTNNDKEQVVAWMLAETWFTSSEAVEHGFADKLSSGEKVDNVWNLSSFKNAPVKTVSQLPPVLENENQIIFDRDRLLRNVDLLARIG